ISSTARAMLGSSARTAEATVASSSLMTRSMSRVESWSRLSVAGLRVSVRRKPSVVVSWAGILSSILSPSLFAQSIHKIGLTVGLMVQSLDSIGVGRKVSQISKLRILQVGAWIPGDRASERQFSVSILRNSGQLIGSEFSVSFEFVLCGLRRFARIQALTGILWFWRRGCGLLRSAKFGEKWSRGNSIWGGGRRLALSMRRRDSGFARLR